MTRQDVDEVYFIAPICNIASILQHGILSHRRASKHPHESIADDEVQDIRSRKLVPGTTKRLHDYANVYFNPRNPMMFKRREMHENLCVLVVSSDILDDPDVIVTDGNAACTITKFLEPTFGLSSIDKATVYAKYWNDDNPIVKSEKKRRICAEVLVPDKIDPAKIRGVYVSCEASRQKVLKVLGERGIKIGVAICQEIFFG